MRTINSNRGFRGSNYVRVALALATCAAAPAFPGQTAEKNINPYAPSPAGNSRPSARGNHIVETASIGRPASAAEGKLQVIRTEGGVESVIFEGPQPTSLTEIYRVGIGDVIQIKIKNAASGFTYNTVSPTGTIDFPLAGEDVAVAGLTTEEISKKLERSIKLFSDAKVDVAVREYASHPVEIVGNVKNPGPVNLRREAVPLFVLKAGAMIDNGVNVVKITKAGGDTRSYRLHDAATDGILIGSETTLEFGVENLSPQARYFVAKGQMKTEERPIILGLTLSKVVASESADARKANIHRQDKKGIFTVRGFDLQAIRAGKSADPPIVAGDIIQIQD